LRKPTQRGIKAHYPRCTGDPPGRPYEKEKGESIYNQLRRSEMKKITTILVSLLIGVFVFAVFSGSAQAQDKKIVAKLADTMAPDHPHTRTWVYFAEKVKEKTNGRVEVQVFHSGQLGQTKDL
jgi:TRAP-type mannitol/chloroaromatic compound transport system substrate-binding protein